MSQAHLQITHRVSGNVHSVFSGFTRELFEQLSPVFPPAKLVRYDGNSVGDIVHLRLGLRPLTQNWVSEIVEHECCQRECYFTDIGRKLPWPLTQWRHRHLLQQVATDEVDIIEDITFGTNFALLTTIVSPILNFMFLARGPKYRAYFNGPRGTRDLSTEPSS